jgi:mycothiol synthase
MSGIAETPKPLQLQMLWPENLLHSPPGVNLPADYEIRTYEPRDRDAYLKLMASAGFTAFTESNLQEWLKRVLPKGLFVILHRPTGEMAATTMATHNPSDLHPFGGELGWVAGSPAHAGKGLGRAVCAAVVARFLQAGYERIYLKTDDWRLPAIKVYLQLGFVPFLFTTGMEERWKTVCGKLKWAFTPDRWPRQG